MVVDTSAIIALIVNAPAAAAIDQQLRTAPARRMSAPTYVALSETLLSRDPILRRRVDDLLDAYGVTIEPFTAEHARIARDALRDYGGEHPAQLTTAHVYSYALAAATGEPLLFVGGDLARTGVTAALS